MIKNQPRCHVLKTIAPYFEEVASRRKTFEVRKDDRGFQVGDTLVLEEIDEQGWYTGRNCTVEVVYKLSGGQFGIESWYCVLGIKLLARSK